MKNNKKSTKLTNNNVEKDLRRYAEIPIEELFDELQTSVSGLNLIQVEELSDIYGKNVITIGSKNTKFKRLLNSIINPFNVI